MKKLFIFSIIILQGLVLLSQTRFISPDGKKKVLINPIADGRYQVLVNSSLHNYYQQIVKNKIYFITDSFKVAYIAKCDDGYCVVVDGIEDSHYKKIINNKLTFSPDNSHWAYMAIKKNKKNVYVIDGIEQTEYDGIISIGITYSPDSRHWAYAVLNNKKWLYIIDGKEQPQYDGIINIGITYSPDSKHWAYAALNNNEWFYVIDGEEQQHYQDIAITGIIYSYDSKKWAYGAFNKDEWICVSNEPILCNTYKLPITSPPRRPDEEHDYFEFGIVKSISFPSSHFQNGEHISFTEGNGGVILPKLSDRYGFNITYGSQEVRRKSIWSTEFNYTHLFPKATWNNLDIKIKYYYYIDLNSKISYTPTKKLSFDLLLGLNLMTRMKIEDGSFKYNNNGNISEIEDAKIKGGIIKGFPFNALCGFGISFKVAPKLIISANANARYVVFKSATGAMGSNKEFIGFLFNPDYRGLLAWEHDPNYTFQISTRFLLDQE